jgi:hypothetical protein
MEKVGKLIADTKITLNGISKHPYWINIKKSTPVNINIKLLKVYK